MSKKLSNWLVEPGLRPDLSAIDPGSSPGGPNTKKELSEAAEKMVRELSDLQVRLWAERKRSLLLVLQALDAGGKDGTIRKVFTGINPQGVRVHSFKVPSEEERSHDFLWRIHAGTPGLGEIGVFNRSHYEDVLIVRVNELVPKPVWHKRYKLIRDFEENLVEGGTEIVKVFLHISKEEQAERFRARLEDPTKLWKFSKDDLAVREKWDLYQQAYTDAIAETSTEGAPWYVVPADSKRYRDWAVLRILVETMREMDPQFPDPEPGLEHVEVV